MQLEYIMRVNLKFEKNASYINPIHSRGYCRINVCRSHEAKHTKRPWDWWEHYDSEALVNLVCVL